MSSILSLAPEPFCRIIELISVGDLIQLWICGDKSMHWRLSKGNVVREVVFKDRRLLNPVCPSIIAHLDGLETFSASIDGYGEEEWILSSDLAKLSSKLKNMNLNFQFDIDVLNELFEDSPAAFPCLESLSISCRGHAMWSSVEFRLEQKSLTKLTLGTLQSSLKSLSIDWLPPALTELWCHVRTFEFTENGTRFPETLLSLSLVTPGKINGLSHLLPRSCERLHYSGMVSDHDPLKFKDWEAINGLELKYLFLTVNGAFEVDHACLLPKTLVKLVLLSIRRDYVVEWALKILEELPRNLTTLKGLFVSQIDTQIAKALPTTLTKIKSYDLEHEAIPYLPSKLKTIEIWKKMELNQIRAFPSQLRTLFIPLIPQAIARILPNTLTAMFITSPEAVLTETTAECLPRSLRLLHMYGSHIQHIDSLRCFQKLPPGLTDLMSIQDVDNAQNEIWALAPPQSASWLPRPLKHLQFGCLDMILPDMHVWFSDIPVQLSTLLLHVNTFTMAHLAPLASHDYLKSLTIFTWNEPSDGWTQSLDFLPLSLTELKFDDLSYNPSDTNITDDSFAKVPHSVTKISLPLSPLLGPHCNLHLPNLETLYLGGFTPTWFNWTRR